MEIETTPTNELKVMTLGELRIIKGTLEEELIKVNTLISYKELKEWTTH